jgi:hypothetical protein
MSEDNTWKGLLDGGLCCACTITFISSIICIIALIMTVPRIQACYQMINYSSDTIDLPMYTIEDDYYSPTVIFLMSLETRETRSMKYREVGCPTVRSLYRRAYTAYYNYHTDQFAINKPEANLRGHIGLAIVYFVPIILFLGVFCFCFVTPHSYITRHSYESITNI